MSKNQIYKILTGNCEQQTNGSVNDKFHLIECFIAISSPEITTCFTIRIFVA